MIALLTKAQRSVVHARGDLHRGHQGGVVAVRLPPIVTGRVVAEAVARRVDWLLLDATAVAEPVESLVAGVTAAAIAAGRPLGRTCMVIRRRVPGAIATFSSAADACQAKVLWDEGYGTGWTVTPPVGGFLAPGVDLVV